MTIENTAEISAVENMTKQEMSKKWTNDRSAKVLTKRHETWARL
ncbi:MAG: hypothetical protein WA667_26650 [Candidatus Nitrosopolaris sp.]